MAKIPEKTPEDLEQVHEHNRKVLRQLLFDSAKWLSTQHAIHALRASIPAFESALQAAIELHKQMRSGALPWATRSLRLCDGLPVSHMITGSPAPADLDAVTPENLIAGMREISEGDNIVVRCFDFVDRQLFNGWLGALQARQTQASTPSPSKQEENETAIELAAQELRENSKLIRAMLYKRLFGSKDERAASLRDKQWFTHWSPGRFRYKVWAQARERAELPSLASKGRPQDK